MPTHFASSEPLDATSRRPHPERLREALDVPGGPKAAEAALALGLETVGDLLLHLPRDTGEARTIATLGEEETATVLVEVRSIRSRPVRRRGMKPLVVATVADATGVMEATFFNQPWLERHYRPGTRLMLTGKYQGRGRFRVNHHALTYVVTAIGETTATYPATKGITSTQILALVREHLAAAHDAVELLPARLRLQERLPGIADAITAAHVGDREAGRRRLAFDEL